MNGYMNKYSDFHEIMNKEEMEAKVEEYEFNSSLPRDFFNATQDPNNIVWKINN